MKIASDWKFWKTYILLLFFNIILIYLYYLNINFYYLNKFYSLSFMKTFGTQNPKIWKIMSKLKFYHRVVVIDRVGET